MMKLDVGNVLLKPSQQKQLLASLRRPQKLGERLGSFFLTITLQRQGRHYDVRADVRDRAGTFKCHARNRDRRAAMRDLVRRLTSRLHAQAIPRRNRTLAA